MSEFNFKSAICTSREQSERLLALGLKPETADMHWYKPVEFAHDYWFMGIGPEWCGVRDIPAWSLHRLIEMMPEEIDRYFCTSFLTLSKNNVYYNESVDGAPDMEFEKNNLYDSIIDCIEWLIKEKYFKNEYLV